MGKASSAKKVARAARAGGRPSSGRPRGLLFPGVLSLVVVLGISLVVFARAERQSVDMGGVPQFGDHIHMAFGVNACGEWLPDLPEYDTRVGIHTHADGVIHVHPFSSLGIGANATLSRFIRDADDPRGGNQDVSLSDSSLTWMGQDYSNNDSERCDDVDDPLLRVAFWDRADNPDVDPRITTGGFGSIRLDQDGAGITVFYGDPGADIPRPPTSDRLVELGALDGATPPIASDPPDDVEAVQEGVLDEDGNIILQDADGDADADADTDDADSEDADSEDADDEDDGQDAGDQ